MCFNQNKFVDHLLNSIKNKDAMRNFVPFRPFMLSKNLSVTLKDQTGSSRLHHLSSLPPTPTGPHHDSKMIYHPKNASVN